MKRTFNRASQGRRFVPTAIFSLVNFAAGWFCHRCGSEQMCLFFLFPTLSVVLQYCMGDTHRTEVMVGATLRTAL